MLQIVRWAVDDDRLAAHPSRCGAREERDDVRDFTDVDESFECGGRGELGKGLFGGNAVALSDLRREGAQHRGVDVAGADSVYPSAELRNLGGETLHEPDEPEL